MRAIKRAYVRGYPNRTGELAEARARLRMRARRINYPLRYDKCAKRMIFIVRPMNCRCAV